MDPQYFLQPFRQLNLLFRILPSLPCLICDTLCPAKQPSSNSSYSFLCGVEDIEGVVPGLYAMNQQLFPLDKSEEMYVELDTAHRPVQQS
jgi:hypothetical protein